MGLLARDRTQVSWPGVSCSSMERFHSWSRCVYNYTLGNRILSVYKRRMFWQLLGFFAKSLRKQLWIPSWLLPLAAREPGNTGTRSPAPRPLELALSREASLALLIHGCSGSSHSSCGFSPTKPRVAVCSLQLGLCRSLMRVPAGPASRRGLTLKFQADDPDSARARRPPLRQWKAPLATLSSRLRRGHHPLVVKASWASQEKSCAVNDLEKSMAPAKSPSPP